MTKKCILITGSTDGIGLATARRLLSLGHQVLLHGRNAEKLDTVVRSLAVDFDGLDVESYVADLSHLSEVESLARDIMAKHESLDALINNAGVFVVADPVAEGGLDVRFVVNTIAPYLLTKRLLPIMGSNSRVLNLSSAAQASVNWDALAGNLRLNDGEAYAQSKLAITMWSAELANAWGPESPSMIAVNPGSFLGSKMVQEAYGRAGKDLAIGADILVRGVLDDSFADASGQYFDNDAGRFSAPHPDALDQEKTKRLLDAIEIILAQRLET